MQLAKCDIMVGFCKFSHNYEPSIVCIISYRPLCGSIIIVRLPVYATVITAGWYIYILSWIYGMQAKSMLYYMYVLCICM